MIGEHQTEANSLLYFDKDGWLIPVEEEKVFQKAASQYYKFSDCELDTDLVVRKLQIEGSAVAKKRAIEELMGLAEALSEKKTLSALLRGPHYPFLIRAETFSAADLGASLNVSLVRAITRSLLSEYPDASVSYHSQGNVEIDSNIHELPGLGQDEIRAFIEEGKDVIGWLFPQALSGYSITSQRRAIQRIKASSQQEIAIALGGVLDVGAALVTTPTMLIDQTTYSPIICMSGVGHRDTRYCINVKSYGTSLEFWCMPSALTLGVEQVSEQWSGAISVFKAV